MQRKRIENSGSNTIAAIGDALAAMPAGFWERAIANAPPPQPRRRQRRPIDGTPHTVPSQGTLRGLSRLGGQDLTSREVLAIRKALLAARRGAMPTIDALVLIAGTLHAAGVETIEVAGAAVSYCNLGDPYRRTVMLIEAPGKNPRVEVGCWGDLVDRHDGSIALRWRKGGAR
jgi:hypothetical protein